MAKSKSGIFDCVDADGNVVRTYEGEGAEANAHSFGDDRKLKVVARDGSKADVKETAEEAPEATGSDTPAEGAEAPAEAKPKGKGKGK